MGYDKQLISIVVPVYNAVSTIERCLDSLEKQTYENIEIVIVNDGSTDESSKLIRQYAERDSRFILYESSNSGVAEARNFGVAHSHGALLMFVDSDDYVQPDFVLYMWKAFCQDKTDLVICDFFQNSDTVQNMHHYAMTPGTYERNDFVKKMVRCPGAHYLGVLWNKLYRLDIIRQYKLGFYEKASLGEDFMFNVKYYSYIHKITCISDQLYWYGWANEGSLCAKKKAEEERIEERQRMYLAYENMLRDVNYKSFWDIWKHYYVAKAYFDELEYLGVERIHYRKLLYQRFIKDNKISRLKFGVFWLIKRMKKLKSVLSR